MFPVASWLLSETYDRHTCLIESYSTRWVALILRIRTNPCTVCCRYSLRRREPTSNRRIEYGQSIAPFSSLVVRHYDLFVPRFFRVMTQGQKCIAECGIRAPTAQGLQHGATFAGTPLRQNMFDPGP